MRREAWRQRGSAAAKSASDPAAAAATTEPGLVQPAAMAAAMGSGKEGWPSCHRWKIPKRVAGVSGDDL